MIVEKVSREDWARVSENAHLLVFGTEKPASHERIDFALICVKGDNIEGYLTCKEMDHQTVYWQFGGSLPHVKGSLNSFRGYQLFVNWAQAHYKRVQTRIENTNTAMLKFAMKVGFLIVGVRYVQGSTLLELELEFK